MKGKILIIALLIGGTITAMSLLHSRNKNNEPKEALQHLLANNYSLAEQTLLKDGCQYHFPLPLYRGYIAQAQSFFEESDYFFQSLTQSSSKSNQKEVLLQAYLAQITNAYFQNQDYKLPPLINLAKQYSTENHFLPFFEGLSNYISHRYSDALRLWSSSPPAINYSDHVWMQALTQKCFPTTWQQLHIAHCLVEEGDIETSRAILEKEQHQLDDQNSDYHHLATLLLGLTYLKESAEIPADNRNSYYKLAQFYFERAEKLQPFAREQNRVIDQIKNEVEALLANYNTPFQRDWAFAFIRTLLDWKAHHPLEEISDKIVTQMCTAYDNKMDIFCHTLRKEFESTFFYTTLTEKLHASLVTSIQQAQMDQIIPLWSYTAALAPSSGDISKTVANLTSEAMFRTIYLDDELLEKTRSYLLFWNQLNQNQSSYKQMSYDLFAQAMTFWKKGDQEKKGLHLMEIALQLTPDKKEMEIAIEIFLSNLYKDAESSNMVHRLDLVYDALIGFGFSVEKSLNDRSKLANHLADAEYLYNVRNYAAALTHARWVLKHDFGNEKALRLIGLSSFQMGEYDAALDILSQINTQDIAVQKAIAFSFAYSIQNSQEHIVQIDNIEAFDADKCDDD